MMPSASSARSCAVSGGQDAADFVEAQHAVAVQAVENRAFPLAADNGQRSFYRAALGAVKCGVCGFAHVVFLV